MPYATETDTTATPNSVTIGITDDMGRIDIQAQDNVSASTELTAATLRLEGPIAGIRYWDLLAGKGDSLNWRSAWDTDAQYQIRDIVEHNGSAWIATAISTGMEPSGASAVWDIFAEKGERGLGFLWREEWDATVTYSVGDVVERSGSAWIALQESTGEDPSGSPISGACSLRRAIPDPTACPWNGKGHGDSTVTYESRDIVSRNGSAYIALRATTGNDPASSPMDWALVAEKGGRRHGWNGIRMGRPVVVHRHIRDK